MRSDGAERTLIGQSSKPAGAVRDEDGHVYQASACWSMYKWTALSAVGLVVLTGGVVTGVNKGNVSEKHNGEYTKFKVEGKPVVKWHHESMRKEGTDDATSVSAQPTASPGEEESSTNAMINMLNALQCSDNDAKVQEATGQVCADLTDYCDVIFCPACPYHGFCDSSCGYCPTPAPTAPQPTPNPTPATAVPVPAPTAVPFPAPTPATPIPFPAPTAVPFPAPTPATPAPVPVPTAVPFPAPTPATPAPVPVPTAVPFPAPTPATPAPVPVPTAVPFPAPTPATPAPVPVPTAVPFPAPTPATPAPVPVPTAVPFPAPTPATPAPVPVPTAVPVPAPTAPTAQPTTGCMDDDIKVMKATEHTCAYFAEMGEGHCAHVFCPDCPFANFCDRACGWCMDADGVYREAEWDKESLTMTDLSDVKEQMVEDGTEVPEAEDDDDDFDDDDEAFVDLDGDGINDADQEDFTEDVVSDPAAEGDV